MLTRTLDDYWSDFGHKLYIDAIEKINKEGGFGTQESGGKTSDLSIRDALNRIIHARDVRPVYDTEDASSDPKARWGMDGQIELQGEHNKRAWAATLNIFGFLDGVIEVLDLSDFLNS